jgi:hypothetical protein
MKKTSSKQKLYQKRRAEKIIRKKCKSKKRKNNKPNQLKNLQEFIAPHTFSISKEGNSRKILLNLLGNLGEQVVLNKQSVCLNLKNVEQLQPSATLLFISELHRITKLKEKNVKIHCIFPNSRKVKQVFSKLNLFKFLGKPCNIVDSLAENIQHWQFAYGAKAEGEKTDVILDKYDGQITKRLTSGLYVGLTEAMANSHHHAYIRTRSDNLDPDKKVSNWWMLSQERGKFLYVAFCDLGVGIPETLPTTHPSLWQKIISLGQVTNNDGLTIKEATGLKMTGTDKKGRGYGLNQMVNTVANELQGIIKIYSNHGMYRAESNDKNFVENFDSSINGTIIEWTIPITPQQENHYETINQHS